MRRWIAMGAVLVAGCGGGGDGGPCHSVAGTWRTTMVEVSGNCGDIAGNASVFDADGGPIVFGVVNGECTGPITASDDLCDAMFQRQCPIYDANGVRTGSATWNGASTIINSHRMEGTMVICFTSADGPDSCCSTYDFVTEPL